MAEVTIVTGFFDLDRKNWVGFERSSNTYIAFFKFWAGLKNKIIIYSDADTCEQVLQIRKKLGLLEKTEAVIIDDYKALEPELYLKIQKAMQSPFTKKFRLKPDNPESWNADYNYIMLLKEWCLKDAAKNHITTDTLAWMDIGFNKGGAYYTKQSEFNFLWECEIDENINLFQLQPMDDVPLFEVVRNMSTYIQGGLIILPKRRCEEFWNIVRESMLMMAECNLADDDQTVLLLSYRRNPSVFTMHPSVWFEGLKICGNPDLSTIDAQDSTQLNMIGRIMEVFVKAKYQRVMNKKYAEYAKRTVQTLKQLEDSRKV